MKTLTFYEQVGILIPGATLLFGLLVLLPNARPVIALEGVTVGGLGLFLIAAYALGHVVAALGNFFEAIYWKLFGGMPSSWITADPPKLLSPEQVERVRERSSERFSLDCPSPRGLPRARWRPLFAQIYRETLVKNPGRLEAFNGNYGLNRGLAAAAVCVGIVAIISKPGTTGVGIAIAAFFASGLYIYRMHRFAVHFATEVYLGFLNAEDRKAAPSPIPERAE